MAVRQNTVAHLVSIYQCLYLKPRGGQPKKAGRPPEGTPEFETWLREQVAKDFKNIFGDNYQPADFEEGGEIFGDIKNIEEYTPEERRKPFKNYTQDKNNNGKNKRSDRM